MCSWFTKNPQKGGEKAEESTDSKKGKKGKGKKAEDADGKKKLFDVEEVSKHLKEAKLIPDEYDPDFDQKIYDLLQDRLAKLYETLKIELFESKKSLTTDIIQELQAKLEDRMIMIQIIQKSIGYIENKYENIDTAFIIENLCAMLKPIAENMILLYCKKYGLPITPTFFFKSLEENKEPEPKNGPLSDKQVFRNDDTSTTAIEMLPKDLQKLLKGLMENIKEKKFKEFIENLQKNATYYSLKINIQEKKVEKNFFLAQKFFIKEGLENPKLEEKAAFFNLLSYLVLEQNLYFGFKNEDKAMTILQSILTQEMGLNEDVKKDIQKAYSIYKDAASSDTLAEINKKLIAMLK